MPARTTLIPLQPVTHLLGHEVDKFGQIRNLPLDSPCPPGFVSIARTCWERTRAEARRREYEFNRQHGFIPTLLEVGPYFAAGIATLASAGAASPTLGLLGTAKAAATVGLKTLSASGAVASLVPKGGTNVGINLGGILGAVGGLLGSVSSVPILQTVGQVASSVAPAFAAQPLSNIGPIYQPQPSFPMQPQATPVMAGVPVIAAGAGAIARMTAPILFAISSKLGRRVSLQAAISMVRKMGKFLMDPAAIAIALGISLADLAILITAHSSKKHRRMNAANGKALHRAARRIKSFHRMCQHVDLLKSRGRRTSTRCGTCRKSPCRC